MRILILSLLFAVGGVFTSNAFASNAVAVGQKNLVVDPFTGDAFQPLAAITNDRNTSVDKLYLVVSAQDTVQGIRFMPQGATTPSDFTNADMTSSDGANLEHDSHRPLVLHATFNPATPNQVDWVVDYLSNGLFGSYKSCNAAVVRDAQGAWHILNVYTNTPVTQLRITTWTLGITTVQGICP